MKTLWKIVWILLSLLPVNFLPAFAHGPDQPGFSEGTGSGKGNRPWQRW